jgi:hypothetical protein
MSIEYNVNVFNAIALAKGERINAMSLWDEYCRVLIDEGFPHSVNVEDARVFESCLIEARWVEVVSPVKGQQRLLTSCLEGWQGVIPLAEFKPNQPFLLEQRGDQLWLVALDHTPKYVNYLSLDLQHHESRVYLKSLQPGLPHKRYRQHASVISEAVLPRTITQKDAKAFGFKAACCQPID